MTKTRYNLTLEAAPEPSDPDGSRRLRMGLKALLRRFGLRCVSAQAVSERPESAAVRGLDGRVNGPTSN